MSPTRYYLAWDLPAKLLRTTGDQAYLVALNPDTGAFERNSSLIGDVLFGHEKVSALDEDGFIQRVEAIRGRNLTGDGPVFVLYEVIRAIEDTASKAGRALTADERARIEGFRRKSYELFQALHPDPGPNAESKS